jgi:hypothetical protein
MAVVYFAQNTYLKLGTYDMSSVVQSASLNINYDQLEITAAGDSAHKYLKGLASHQLTGTLYLTQDAIAAGSSRAVLDSLKGTSAAFEIAPNGSTASATNPKYSGSVFVNGYTPVNNAIGEVAMIDFTFDLTTDVTIATS